MSVDLSGFRVTGTNNGAKQVSVDRWNSLLDVIAAAIGAGSSSAVVAATSREELADLSTVLGLPAYFDGSNWELVSYSSVSALAAADTLQGVCLRSVYDPTKAWVRRFFSQVSVKWFGAKGDGTPGDDVPINCALNVCFGSPRHTSTTAALNWQLHFPGGNYVCVDELDGSNLYGFHITGDERLASTITQQTVGKRLWVLDAVAYGEMRSLGVASAPGVATGALIDLDWTGAHSGLKPQQITFADLLVHGQNVSQVGVQIAKSGGGAQGDTIDFSNVLVIGFREAGYQIGLPTNPAYNALSIRINGGDIQGCTKHGVANYGGSVIMDGTSEQPQDPTFRQQREGGFLLYCVGNPDPSIMKNVRSEGSRLCGGGGPIFIENCIATGSTPEWTPGTSYSRGTLIRPIDGSTNCDGRVWAMCGSAAGTSGSTEPNWKAQPVVGREPGFLGPLPPLSVGQATFVPPGGASAYPVGAGIWIKGAGAAGGDLFTTIAANNGTSVTLTDAVQTAVTSPAFRHSGGTAALSDGTCKWMHWEFAGVEARSAIEVQMRGGFIKAEVVERCTFSRPDVWLHPDSGKLSRWETNWYGNGGIHYRGYPLHFKVAKLPTPGVNYAPAGTSVFVEDANAPTFNATVAGGGASLVRVHSDGISSWKVG